MHPSTLQLSGRRYVTDTRYLVTIKTKSVPFGRLSSIESERSSLKCESEKPSLKTWSLRKGASEKSSLKKVSLKGRV